MSCCSNPNWKNQVARGALDGVNEAWTDMRPLTAAAVPPPSNAHMTGGTVTGTGTITGPVSLTARASAAEIPSNDAAILRGVNRAATAPPVDKIFVNGTFLLATPTISDEQVTAVAVAGDTIVDVGAAQRILGAYPSATQIDLKGTVLSPGFIEAHAHIISAVQTAYCIDVGYSVCPTYQSVLDAITKAIAGATTPPVKGTPPPWFFFMSYDPSLLDWTSAGFPQLGFQSLDLLKNGTNCCIFVENASGHIAYANSLAFSTCGITATTPPPAGSYWGIVNGKLNGIMFEPPSFTQFLDNAPKQTAKSVLGKMGWLLSQAQQVGVTTVCDPAVGIGGDLPGELALYALLASDSATDVVGSIDLTCMYNGTALTPVKGLTGPTQIGGTGSFGNLTVPNMKLWTDGSTQGYTAYVSEAYLPPVTPQGIGDTGEPDWNAQQLQSMLNAAKAQKWSTLVHANGDAAIAMAITALQALAPTYGTKFRDRIEHCTVTMSSAPFAQLAALGVTPTFLNNHIYIWGDTLNQHILGNARASRLDATQDALAAGLIFSFHCDYSVSLPDPLRYMQTAVTRTTSGGTVLGADQAINALQALQAVTIWPAQQLGIDGTVGSIAQGKRANFVQLAQDPTQVQPDQIASVQVIGTYLRGNWIAGPAPHAAAPHVVTGEAPYSPLLIRPVEDMTKAQLIKA